MQIDGFDGRWNRLVDVRNLIARDYFDELCEQEVTVTDNELTKIYSSINKMNEIHQYVDNNIEEATTNDLNRYATSIKNFALEAIKQCAKYNVISDIDSVSYDADRKIIQINNEDFYFLG